MKGYGLPRNHDVSSPDAVDGRYYALKTSATGSDIKNKSTKATSRRIFKKLARLAGKKSCKIDD